MKKIFCILLILSFITIPVYASNTSGTVFLFLDDKLLNLESDNSYTVSDINSFEFYLPFYNHGVISGDSTIISWTTEMSFSNGINFESFRPSGVNYGFEPPILSVVASGSYTHTTGSDFGSYYGSNNIGTIYQRYDYVDSLVNDKLVINSVLVLNTNAKNNTFNIKYNVPLNGTVWVNLYNFEIKNISAPSTEVQDAIGDLSNINSSGFSGVTSAVDSLYQLSQDSYFEEREFLSDIRDQIISVDSHMTDNVVSALEDWQQQHIDVAESDLSNTVNDFSDQISSQYDYDGIHNVVQQLYSMVTGGSSRSGGSTVLPIPAGTVSVSGQTFTFWEATEIDFGPYFDIPVFKTLLIVFRFVMSYGMISYCVYWFRKICDLVTLHIHVPHNNNSGE